MARPTRATVLPELVTVGQLARELGVSRSAALAIFRQLPEQQVPGLRRTYVRRSDVQSLLDANYFAKRLSA